VDDVEDWKEELVEKINVIEVEKPMRRSSGMTEERYHRLADKKENLLRIRIPDVEMMILDAEEACDRFRFTLALGMLDEARETMTLIEQELAELKTDTSKVAVAKQENKVVVPEIGKLVEQVERRLSDIRLEYGLSFHELKSALDEVETMRSLIKTARAAGDDIHAYDTTVKAQQLLEGMVQSMGQIPSMVQRVKKELPEEFKQLEEGIDQAVRDGFDLDQDSLENALLQAKQLITAAKTALEEGSLELVNTHAKAFEVLIDATYQGIEEAVLAQREAAAASSRAHAIVVEDEHASQEEAQPEDSQEILETEEQEEMAEIPQEKAEDQEVHTLYAANEESTLLASGAEKEVAFAAEERVEEAVPVAMLAESSTTAALSQEERDVLLNVRPQQKAAAPAVTPKAEEVQALEEDEEEYELVIPKRPVELEEVKLESERLVIETEDDALDELERISSTLVRVRQQIKRSYLPGLPEHLKYMFEEIVLTLARIKAIMEQYRYDLEEVAILIQDANELVDETERMAERIISTCQLAEGAIQYTNRYRRQNRQVNELLTKAEHSFRQLAFAEAYQLAEEARLVVEGAPAENDSRWLLRRKKKG
jgi:septation ring formation regulator